MGWMETIFLLVMISLCAIVIKSDLTEGIVYNKILLFYLAAAVAMDIVYYGFFHRDIVFPFIINSLVVFIIALVLFYTHCFAGGDCKLLMVLVLLLPAKCYLSYGKSLITVVFAIGFAFFFGYVYLLLNSLFSLVKKKSKVTGSYIKNHILTFVKSFITALIYISGLTLVIKSLAMCGVVIHIWIVRVLCLACSWMIGRNKIFRKKGILCVVIAADVILSVLLKTIPLSIHPENYILVVVLLLCQMTIKTGLYEEIPVGDLKKGIILTMGTTLMMHNSRVRGLPGISSEDLRNRLSEDEVESVKRWASAKKIETVMIVKKIPFAAFIALGFITYWIIWGILKWG